MNKIEETSHWWLVCWIQCILFSLKVSLIWPLCKLWWSSSLPPSWHSSLSWLPQHYFLPGFLLLFWPFLLSLLQLFFNPYSPWLLVFSSVLHYFLSIQALPRWFSSLPKLLTTTYHEWLPDSSLQPRPLSWSLDPQGQLPMEGLHLEAHRDLKFNTSCIP